MLSNKIQFVLPTNNTPNSAATITAVDIANPNAHEHDITNTPIPNKNE